jgi:hypothetical protein
MTDIMIRFLIDGFVLSLFAMFSGLRPKSFAGLFEAAPSIALATLGVAINRNGLNNAALEARSMLLGALGFLSYAATAVGYFPSKVAITI